MNTRFFFYIALSFVFSFNAHAGDPCQISSANVSIASPDVTAGLRSGLQVTPGTLPQILEIDGLRYPGSTVSNPLIRMSLVDIKGGEKVFQTKVPVTGQPEKTMVMTINLPSPGRQSGAVEPKVLQIKVYRTGTYTIVGEFSCPLEILKTTPHENRLGTELNPVGGPDTSN